MQKPIFSVAPPQTEDHFEPDAQIILYPGDVGDFLHTVPDESVSLVVTSPPYNLALNDAFSH